MEEAGAGDVGHRGADLLPGVDHVDAERVHRVTSEVEDKRKERDVESGNLAFRAAVNPSHLNNTATGFSSEHASVPLNSWRTPPPAGASQQRKGVLLCVNGDNYQAGDGKL